MADTKSYDPKTASVTDVYMVDDDGHDRWFIPMLAPEATMAKQLAQCQALSPHGEGRDEHPDDPLAINSVGQISAGELRLGQSTVATAATAIAGAQPYVTSVQIQTSTTGTSNWTNWGGATTPDAVGRVIWTNTTVTAGKYYRIITTITDAEDTVITNTSDSSAGPVTTADASFIETPPTPADQTVGNRETYVWLGEGNYTVTMEAAYMNSSGAWVEMADSQDYASALNSQFPNLGLLSLIANLNGGNCSIVVASAGAGISVGEALQLKGQCTDTYSTVTNSVNQGMVINFTATLD